jgi:integrase
MKRHHNGGVRKVCGCARRGWAKCPHPWHFNFRWEDKHYRFSVDQKLGRHVESKGEAEDLAGDWRKAIKAGNFGQPVRRSELTLREFTTIYEERYIAVERSATAEDHRSGLRVICDTMLSAPTGERIAFGAWRLADLTTDTIERYREARRAAGAGLGGTNRSLSRLRALLNWGVRLGYLESTPYRRGGVSVVKLSREVPRSRRLNADTDEEAKLLAACGPHLRAVVECALETGMRRGEILDLRWEQIEGMRLDGTGKIEWAPRVVIALKAAQTKTKRDRKIPISSRLKAILEMRRYDPAGQPLPLTAYVFGNELGQKVDSTKRAWNSAVLKAHGYPVKLSKTTMNLTPECRAALQAIDLHFHDLRREAGSRWMDAGTPLATIQRWLGHTKASQTSTYLAGSDWGDHQAMQRIEEARERQQQRGVEDRDDHASASQSGSDSRLQRIATDAGSGGQTAPQSAKGSTKKANKIAVGYEPTIM